MIGLLIIWLVEHTEPQDNGDNEDAFDEQRDRPVP